jgi:undecaprenyl-diphosphatase
MPLYYIVILALVQGISEFLPISSSGHLILTHAILQQGDGPVDYWGENLTLDIAVHVGSLLAILVYFRQDIRNMILGVFEILRTRRVDTQSGRMALLLVAGTIPVVVAGLIMHIFEPAWGRSLQVAAWSLIIFGILLGIADKFCPDKRTVESLTLKDALLVGLAQMLALVPGTSRSGITMTAARALGFSRVEAARFSFLLGTLAISGAGALGAIDLLENPSTTLLLDVLVGILVSCLSALAAVHFLMSWLKKASFSLFVWYRVGLGLLLLGLFQAGILN